MKTTWKFLQIGDFLVELDWPWGIKSPDGSFMTNFFKTFMEFTMRLMESV